MNSPKNEDKYGDDSALKVACTPPDYYLLDQSQKDHKGGGIAVFSEKYFGWDKSPPHD